MRTLAPLIIVLASAVGRVWGLSCLPCREVTCEMPAIVSRCSWGFVLDMCGCCYVCGKGPGSTCGGQWAWHGRCGRGLDCRRPGDVAQSRGGSKRRRVENGGNALALLNMEEPRRCYRRSDTVADKITTFFNWISSLFQNKVVDD